MPFAVVQRPKPRWEQLFANSEEIDVGAQNGEVKMKGAQVLAAGTSGRRSVTQFQTNLNVTWSRRWRLQEAVARGGFRDGVRSHLGDGPGHFPGLRRVLRGSSRCSHERRPSPAPRRGDARGDDLDPVRITWRPVSETDVAIETSKEHRDLGNYVNEDNSDP